MGKFWKALGGAALGVITVACLPVAGPIGVVTLAGAAVAGTIGGTAGVIADSMEDDKEMDAFRRGRESGKAESYSEVEQLKSKLAKASNRFTEYRELEDLLCAVFAVGISVAACDGEVRPEEKQDIRDFVSGASFESLPQGIKSIIIKLENNPPNFNQAMDYVRKINKIDWEIIDDVIELAMYADEIIRSEEKAYKEAWTRFKATA